MILSIGGTTSFLFAGSHSKKVKGQCCTTESKEPKLKKSKFLKNFIAADEVQEAEEVIEKSCVFRSLMGEDPLSENVEIVMNDKVKKAIDQGKRWIFESQLADGGWASAYTTSQSSKNAKSDPATTSLVGMALMRSNPDIESEALTSCFEFLIQATESSSSNQENITTLSRTQPQVKLGQNIDVVLAAQFFANALDFLKENDRRVSRIKKCLNLCTAKIESNQNDDGSSKRDGWAGVLQSSFANNALESAQKKGAKVDEVKLERSRSYQKGNYDLSSGRINTDKGAGVMLYSVSGSSRGTASETKDVKAKMKVAKRDGILKPQAKVSVENLEKIGYSEDEAQKSYTAYEINTASKTRAQEDAVMSGFGNNGGEEFLSYLQTGEGLVIAEDEDWGKWYEKVSATLLNIQNSDGSWNGHHCITSPVFCTATCILILSIQNDIENLQASLN